MYVINIMVGQKIDNTVYRAQSGNEDFTALPPYSTYVDKSATKHIAI